MNRRDIKKNTFRVWRDNDAMLADWIACNHELLNNGEYPSRGPDTLETALMLNRTALKMRDLFKRVDAELAEIFEHED